MAISYRRVVVKGKEGCRERRGTCFKNIATLVVRRFESFLRVPLGCIFDARGYEHFEILYRIVRNNELPLPPPCRRRELGDCTAEEVS